jgi:toxin ParE1/3/4
MRKFIKSPQADRDLLGIWAQLAAQDLHAADRLLEFIEDRCEVVRRFPLGGEACPQYGFEMRWYFAGHYVIFYRPYEDGIEVVRVIDGRRDLPRAFRRES